MFKVSVLLLWFICFFVSGKAATQYMWPTNPVQQYQSDIDRYVAREQLKYLKLKTQDYPVWYFAETAKQYKGNLLFLMDTANIATFNLPQAFVDRLLQAGYQVILMPVPAYQYTEFESVEGEEASLTKHSVYLQNVSDLVKQSRQQFTQVKPLTIVGQGQSAAFLTELSVKKQLDEYQLMVWWQANLTPLMPLQPHLQKITTPVLDIWSAAASTQSLASVAPRATIFRRQNNPYYRQVELLNNQAALFQQQFASQLLGYLEFLRRH